MTRITLAELAKKLGATVHGNGDVVVHSIASMSKAGEGDITFLSDAKYRKQMGDCQASAVIVKEADVEFCQSNALVMKDPYLGFALAAQALDTTPAPAKAANAIGGVTFEVCDNQKTMRCAVNNGKPKSLNIGTAMTANTI